jgi:hypothetical protein
VSADFKSLDETRSVIRKETCRCLSEILNEVQPPPLEQPKELSGDPADKLTSWQHTRSSEDLITESSDSDELKEDQSSDDFAKLPRKALTELKSSSPPDQPRRSSPPPLEATEVALRICTSSPPLRSPSEVVFISSPAYHYYY